MNCPFGHKNLYEIILYVAGIGIWSRKAESEKAVNAVLDKNFRNHYVIPNNYGLKGKCTIMMI